MTAEPPPDDPARWWDAPPLPGPGGAETGPPPLGRSGIPVRLTATGAERDLADVFAAAYRRLVDRH